MSKTITIPSNKGSRVTVVLNGVMYVYKAGETETVPDEVAALLESNAEADVIYGRRASAPLEAEGPYDENDFIDVYADSNGQLKIRKADIQALIPAPELPEVSGDDEGKVLTVSDDGEWVAASLPI